MFKKSILAAILLSIFLMLVPQAIFAAPSIVDQSALSKGIISIHYTSRPDTKVLVRISKENVKYDYTFEEGDQYPLQLGNGTYKVLVGESIGNNKYKVIAQEQIEVKLADEKTVFLQSIPLIDWSETSKAVVKAKKLTADKKTDMDKLKAIYAYITTNFTYDYKKAQTVADTYIPDLDEVYEASQGICYDFAATFAAMARSEGLPTRLVMGYEASSPETYHAWNQVFLADRNEWVTIDTTYDATRVQGGQATDMFKNADDYQIVKVY
ncbi:transglutaminase-like domain-containing protein [Paenibacillus sp. HWE-109]|uniref:transglutaminase-like domain-containing protein n=1 Tax=Paenibacillus sp. HWE-109 TaxID=1306526 RepID=UPI001EDF2349|nr:transglutaminase-like domain-containing protein [Paenibacillus sp. HWE-109]UKS26238.1 transglutaminase-like domain-containing protein [Paenibacillus sp. HWE-109]